MKTIFSMICAALVLIISSNAMAQHIKVDDYRGQKVDQKADKKETKTKKFTVLMEAPLPKGFPGPGPIAKAVEKHYPISRIAVADNQRPGAFFRLIRHIQKNKVAMTTPVEMEMSVNEDKQKYEMRSMGFFYEAPEQGNAGKDKSVDVKNYPKMHVVSVGIAGQPSQANLTQSRELIQKYLKEKNLEAIGDYRIMGYNSPMVASSRKFFEMQIEVKSAEESK